MSGDSRVLGSEGQDATMIDVGGSGRPPGDPPDEPGSWVKKVVGTSGGGMPVPERVLDDEFVSSRMRVEFPNGEEGEPIITTEREVLEAMNGLWKQCMIVKVLGRHISISNLGRKLRELWKPRGGPWRVFGSYLMVQAWSSEFDPLRDDIVTTPVWMRLSNVPINFYHRSILMGIARGLGRPLRVDETNLKFERARFARICVKVNLAKPLKRTLMINGDRYFVAYVGCRRFVQNVDCMVTLFTHVPKGF